MTHSAEDIRAQIDAELANPRPLRFGHGLNLAECRVGPRRVLAAETGFAPKCGYVWIVLDECSVAGERGYMIVFDEHTGEFGLAVGDREHPTVIGIYGTFLDAVESM